MTAFEYEPIVINHDLQPENLEVFEIIPESIFDARVIAHFDAEINEIDAIRAKYQKTYEEYPDYDQDQKEKEINTFEEKRSKLYSQRAIYEIEIASLDTQEFNPREAHIPLYINNVTIYKDKLAIFRRALALGNIDALVSLGDLRAEAEQSGDITNIALYALEEVRAGINIHENMDTVRVIAAHRSGNITEYNDIAPALINVVYQRIANGDIEGAGHAFDLLENTEPINEHSYSDFSRVNALMIIAESGLTINDVTKRVIFDTNDLSFKSNLGYRKCHYLNKMNTKPEYVKMFRLEKGGTNRDPVTLSMLDDQWDAYEHTTVKLSNMGSGLRSLMETKAPNALRLAEIEALNSLYGIQKKQIRGEEISAADKKYVSFESITRVAVIAKRYSMIDTDDKTFISLNSDLELLIEEYAQISTDRELFKTIDLLRTQVEFNRKIEALFARAKEISSPSSRFKFLEKLIRLQAMHDPNSDDSNLNEQKEELRRAGVLCSENPYESVFVSMEDVEAALEKIDKIASENMQQ